MGGLSDAPNTHTGEILGDISKENIMRTVLLFGMPRSGTTWLGKIFDSHPDTLYRHEPDSRGTLNTLPMLPIESDVEKHRSFLLDYVAKLPAIRDEKISASLPIFTKNYYTVPQLALRKLLVYGFKMASRLLGSLRVPDVINASKQPHLTLVWKSIESLARLGVLARVFPEARCILILRHPCGYVASVLRGEAKLQFESTTSSSEDWGIYQRLVESPAGRARGMTLAQVKNLSPVERLALLWGLYYEHALVACAGLNNVLTVRYEDFCEHPLQESQKAFAHCHLPWAPETEEFIVRSTAQENSAYYSVFKDPKTAASNWQRQLSGEEIRQILQVTSCFAAGNYYSPEASAALSPA